MKRAFTRCRQSPLPRAAVAQVGYLFVALAVLFGVLQARTRYFYCDALGLSASDPCVHETRTDSRCPLASVDRAPFDCCEIITMPSVPEGARSAGPVVFAPIVVAVLSAVPPEPASAWGAGVRVRWENERWRGPPRSSRERRAQLMVSLT